MAKAPHTDLAKLETATREELLAEVRRLSAVPKTASQRAFVSDPDLFTDLQCSKTALRLAAYKLAKFPELYARVTAFRQHLGDAEDRLIKEYA